MNKSITIIAGLFFCAASHQLFAQEAGAPAAGPRDLFNTYKSGTAAVPSSTGRPGVHVRVELDRGGRARWVSSKTVFRAGDKVRFHFAMNFPGYVVIINQGSSGKRSLLFPYPGVSNHLGRTTDYTVPQGEGWFEFDNTPGTEQLTFIMSKREIEEVTQITTGGTHAAHPAPSTPTATHPGEPEPSTSTPPAASAPAAIAPATSHANTEASEPAPQTEEQEILAALNSRSLTRGRDLKMVEDNTDAYVLATDETLAKPVAFKLTLEHH
jgi:hypothetical protein